VPAAGVVAAVTTGLPCLALPQSGGISAGTDQVDSGSPTSETPSSLASSKLFAGSGSLTDAAADIDAESVASLGSFLTSDLSPLSVSPWQPSAGGLFANGFAPDVQTPDATVFAEFGQGFTFSRHRSLSGQDGVQTERSCASAR
jgi:hypothetical protein